MKTEELLRLIKIKTIYGSVPLQATGIQMDSRKIAQGNIFVCVSGSNFDGHDFIEEAVRRGAVLIVAEKNISAACGGTCSVVVKDSAKVMARFANHLYGYPSSGIAAFGVTGTNGKTSVSHILTEILELSGHPAALAGTLGFRLNGGYTPTRNTTSDIISNLEMLDAAASEGCEAITFEISSQGLLSGRGWGIELDIAVFTNLSHDHLDFHRTMERYGYAKGLLFAQLGQDVSKEKYAVLNDDDPWSAEFMKMTPYETISYGLTAGADFYASQIVYKEDGTSFLLHSPEGTHQVSTPFMGEFNLYNVLAALSALYAYGIKMETAIPHLPTIKSVKGRMEKLMNTVGPSVYIDYAHTPDAVEKAISSVLPFKKNRLIVLIGSGNFRDQLKRPLMAEKASSADFVIITVNNPGNEHPQSILANFEAGMLHERYTLIEDRAEAVRRAIEIAEQDDIVLLTDKGHEETLLVGDLAIPYSDKAIAAEQIARKFGEGANRL